jgi:hypothetical protein
VHSCEGQDPARLLPLRVVLIAIQVDDPDVCRGAIAGEGPIIAQDLRGMAIGSHTSQLLCITFFGLCGYPAVTPYIVPFPTPKPAATRPPVSGLAPLKVIHFSDYMSICSTRREQATTAQNRFAAHRIPRPTLLAITNIQRAHMVTHTVMHPLALRIACK